MHKTKFALTFKFTKLLYVSRLSSSLPSFTTAMPVVFHFESKRIFFRIVREIIDIQ